jgi:hypothetical protein
MFLAAVSHNRFLHLPVDVLLGPIGGRDKAIETGELYQQTYQANATGPDFGAHQVDGDHQAMQESKPRSTLEKGHHGAMLIEAPVMGPPGPKRAAGDIECLGGLPQGKPLRFQVEIPVEQLSALAAIPAAGTIRVALLAVLDDGSHGDLLV